MNVVHVLPLIYAGGPTIVVRDILLALKRNNPNFNIELWVATRIQNSRFRNNPNALKFEKKVINELKSDGISIFYSEKKSSKDILIYWTFLFDSLQKFKPDIIHFHSETGTLISLPILFFNKAKIFQTMHSEKILNPKLQKYVISLFVNKFIAVSEAVRISLLKIGIEKKKIVIIHNGIDIKKFEHNRIISKQVKKFIAIGRLTEAKNYKMMILAFISFIDVLRKRGIIDLPILNIIGDGEEKEEIIQYIKSKNAQNNIFLLGIKNNINEYLKESDVYLMSSVWEGLPIVLIEAAASGLPIVATDVGANYLILGEDSEQLIRADDAMVFTGIIMDLYDNYELRETLSKKLIEKANDFSIENVVKRLEILYEN